MLQVTVWAELRASLSSKGRFNQRFGCRFLCWHFTAKVTREFKKEQKKKGTFVNIHFKKKSK